MGIFDDRNVGSKIIISRLEDKIGSLNFSNTYRENIVNKLVDYVDLLYKWSRTHNLVSSYYSRKEIWENIYDSVAECWHINQVFIRINFGKLNIVDAGAGGGFPGIPLSLLFPERKIILVDADRKKCSFLRTAKANLSLLNIEVLNKKVEELPLQACIITKAAFSPPHASILAEIMEQEGELLLWSTPLISAQFVEAFKKQRVFLVDSYDYELTNEKKRRLLVFKKMFHVEQD